MVSKSGSLRALVFVVILATLALAEPSSADQGQMILSNSTYKASQLLARDYGSVLENSNDSSQTRQQIDTSPTDLGRQASTSVNQFASEEVSHIGNSPSTTEQVVRAVNQLMRAAQAATKRLSMIVSEQQAVLDAAQARGNPAAAQAALEAAQQAYAGGEQVDQAVSQIGHNIINSLSSQSSPPESAPEGAAGVMPRRVNGMGDGGGFFGTLGGSGNAAATEYSGTNRPRRSFFPQSGFGSKTDSSSQSNPGGSQLQLFPWKRTP